MLVAPKGSQGGGPEGPRHLRPRPSLKPWETEAQRDWLPQVMHEAIRKPGEEGGEEGEGGSAAQSCPRLAPAPSGPGPTPLCAPPRALLSLGFLPHRPQSGACWE